MPGDIGSSFSSMSPELIQAFTELISVWWTPVQILSYLSGLLVLVAGLWSYKEEGKKGFATVSLVVATMLLSLPDFLDILSFSLFATSAPVDLTYVATGSENAARVTFIVRAVQLVGLIAVFRSLLMFKDWANEMRTEKLYGACIYVVGGAISLNIVPFLEIVGASMGGDVEYVVNLFL